MTPRAPFSRKPGANRRSRRELWVRSLLLCLLAVGNCGVQAPEARAQGPGVAGTPPAAGDRLAPGGKLALSEEDVWRFGEDLLADGEYFRAVTEYKRLLYYFPAGAHAASAQRRIALALLLGGEPAQALRHIDGQLGGASAAERDGWLVLSAIAQMDLEADQPYPLRKPHLDQARADLAAVSAAAPRHEQIAGFLQALDEPPDLPYKSPALAGAMSAVIPGTGSFYVGRVAEGALALFVNTLLISGTVTAFREHQDGLGVGLGILALAFYGGSIYAAVSGAHKFNDRAAADYLEQQRVRFGLILERGRIGLGFEGTF